MEKSNTELLYEINKKKAEHENLKMYLNEILDQIDSLVNEYNINNEELEKIEITYMMLLKEMNDNIK